MNKLTLPPEYNFLPRYGQLALANVLSNLTTPLANLISIGLLGHLSELSYLAGVLLVSAFLGFLYNVFAFLRMSTTGVTAQAHGRNDRKTLVLVGLRNAVVAILIGTLIVLLQHPLQELSFFMFRASAEVKEASISYFNIRIWEAPAVFLNYVLFGWFLGQSQSGKVLWMSIFANTIIVVSDYLLVVHYGWGTIGAGISQLISQYAILGMCLTFITLQGVWKEIWLLRGELLQFRSYASTISLGTDIFIKTFIVTSTIAVFNSQSSTLGTNIFAENSLIFQVALLSGYFTQGFSYATETLTGFFKGEGAIKKLKYLLIVSILSGITISFVFSAIFVCFPRSLFYLLTNNKEVIDIICNDIIWLVLFLTFISLAYSIDGYFLGLAEGNTLRNIAIIALLAGFIPMDSIAWRTHSNNLLWLSLSLFMAVRVVAMGLKIPHTLTEVAETG